MALTAFLGLAAERGRLTAKFFLLVALAFVLGLFFCLVLDVLPVFFLAADAVRLRRGFLLFMASPPWHERLSKRLIIVDFHYHKFKLNQRAKAQKKETAPRLYIFHTII